MSKTVAKNFRLNPTTVQILDAVAADTGENTSRIADLAIACYALEIGVETKRAREYLLDNLSARISANSIHARRPVRKFSGLRAK